MTKQPVTQAELVEALIAAVDLLEGWAYGSIVGAGVLWPNGVCQAPALVKAKALLKRVHSE